MHKQITSILLIAGTCIGGGTIALPMSLSKLGIIPSFILIALIWLLTYYTSLVSVELNLQSERGLSLGQLGQFFSGEKAKIIGDGGVKLLSYALLAVYIYGCSSTVLKLLEVSQIYKDGSLICVETYVALVVTVILLFPMKIISVLNNISFTAFILVFLILTAATTSLIDYNCIPWSVAPSGWNLISVITVVFTSFGYQVIFHTLRDYLGKDATAQRRVFFYGSLIPVILYMLWTGSALSAIFKTNPEFFVQMSAGRIDVGDLVNELANVSQMPAFQTLVWWMSLLAIITSILGVGIGLSESLNSAMKDAIPSSWIRKITVSLIIVAPAYIVAAVVPNAFIKVLGFAGAILTVIAILLPIYLLFKANFKNIYLKELKKLPLAICAIIGVGIIVIELLVNHVMA